METTKKRPGRKNQNIPEDELPNQARALRCRLNLSLEEIGERMNVKAQSVSEFERTGKGLGDLNKYALAHVLGVDLPTLLTPGKKFAENIRLLLDNIR